MADDDDYTAHFERSVDPSFFTNTTAEDRNDLRDTVVEYFKDSNGYIPAQGIKWTSSSGNKYNVIFHADGDVLRITAVNPRT